MSERKYFGTDGIRGQANTHPMTAEIALRLGQAAGKLFLQGHDRRLADNADDAAHARFYPLRCLNRPSA